MVFMGKKNIGLILVAKNDLLENIGLFLVVAKHYLLDT